MRAFYESASPDGTPWTQFFRVSNGYLVRFADLVDFWISRNGQSIEAYPAPGISLQTIEHLRLNQVIPLALSRQMELVLHGGAVEINGTAVAFLGVSGRGKSTLTASFATAGYQFLTDDGLQLEATKSNHMAKASHPSIRLWDDSRKQLIPDSVEQSPPIDYTPKSRLLAGESVPHCTEPAPLKAIYFLGDGTEDNVAIKVVSPRNAMIELVKHSFLLDIEERAMLNHHFSQLTDLVSKVKCFSLDYPRRYEELPRVREAVIEHSLSL